MSECADKDHAGCHLQTAHSTVNLAALDEVVSSKVHGHRRAVLYTETIANNGVPSVQLCHKL